MMSIDRSNEGNAKGMQEGAYGGFDVVEITATGRLNKIICVRNIQQHWALLETRIRD